MTVAKAEIISLAKAGVKPKDIAHRLRIDSARVHNVITRARAAGEGIPKFNVPNASQTSAPMAARQPHLVVPMRLHSLLTKLADARG